MIKIYCTDCKEAFYSELDDAECPTCHPIEEVGRTLMMKEKRFVAIKVKKGVYESLLELKKTLIQHGYNKFPKEFLDFLEKDNFDINKLSYGNMINLCRNAILYLIKEKKDEKKLT